MLRYLGWILKALPADTLSLGAPPEASRGVSTEVWIRCGSGKDRVERVPHPAASRRAGGAG
jgi:hypothetical protein